MSLLILFILILKLNLAQVRTGNAKSGMVPVVIFGATQDSVENAANHIVRFLKDLSSALSP